jgi:acyl-CoA thioesterase
MSSFPNILDAMQVQSPTNGGRCYTAEVVAAWNAPLYPSGGVTTAIALRAMQTELDQPHQTLRSFSSMFVSTVPAGALEIDVERLRIGRRMSQLRSDLRGCGAADSGHVVTAAFGESREGFGFTYSAAPDVDEADAYPGLAEPPAGYPVFKAPFFQNVDVRRVRMFASFESDWEGGRAEAIRWIRYRSTPRLADGRIEPLSLIGLADTMPIAISQHEGPGYPFFHAPSVDLSMRFFADTEDDWVLSRAVCHWAGDGYASAEITLWDTQRRILAHANQLMLVRFPDPQQLTPR